MTEPILELENVSYTYPDGPVAVDDLSVSVGRGERVAVLGSNGAGKSTFFLLCNGILEPSAGCIRCGGRQMSRKKKDLIELHRRVGIVFQEAENQILAVTVEGEVSFGPINLGLPMEEVEQRTADALQRMGLQGYGDRSPQYLSGGEKKRVTIADILAMKPDVILLDEPTASLDPENVVRLERTLDQLTQAGIALMVSTHDVDFAARFARRGLVFVHGKLAADGPMETIFSRQELLEQAGLRKPWIWQAAEELHPGEDSYPMTMEQFSLWKNAADVTARGGN
ncbi:MAG: ATP-binding cassette domain-containing protein [Clostridiales bacterium]|nr:ATP-binding cassette domain-containing protein [Clostridiales bacterium]